MKRHEFFAFVSPSVVLMVGLMVVPLFITIYLSFTVFSFGTTPRWVGWDNYINVLENRRFWNAVAWTLTYIAFTIPLQLLIGFFIALLLDRANRLRGLFISGYLLPFVVTPVVGTLVFSWLFKDKWGFYSYLLSLVGVNIQWYGDAMASRALLIIHAVWYVTPFVILVLFAGLQAMPQEPLEAALVDGATFWQRIWYIVIPHLMPLFIFVTMINVMDAYRVFDSVFVMTRGGPGSATETLMLQVYDVAFVQQSLGRGSAISVLMVLGIFVVLIPFLIHTYREQMETR